MSGGLGSGGDKYHIVNFAEDSGEHASVDETTSMAIFVAPCPCEIIDVAMAVTTAVAANATAHWTINITNQNGDSELLSDNFDTDSDNSGNGGRAFAADELVSLCDTCANNTEPAGEYLQNAVLAKGDILVLTATRASTATALAYPQVVVRYRT